ncbi:MAG: hypothetical protein IH983_12515 [Planctomycetes bacterium]|nr:hypothetical protein [Planctomycetota bacterium]
MPVYLFTFHAYGSWLPDRSQGYVKRGHGILAPNKTEARRYQQRMKHPVVGFARKHQQLMIETTLEASARIDCALHAVATDPTHIHVLMAWRDGRSWKQVRASVRSALSRRLNAALGRRAWFVDSASRQRVKDAKHMAHLRRAYLPSHRGLKWSPTRGVYQ